MSDTDLVRYIDGELTLDERQQIDAVLAGDAALAQRLAVLRRRSARLSMLLAAAGPTAVETAAANPASPEPPAGVTPISVARTARTAERRATAASSQRVWLRAAIALLVVLGSAMAVPPVRAWVVDRLERILGQPAEAPSPLPVALATPPTDNFGIRFAVEGATFSVEVAAAQASGRLVLRPGTSAEGTADVQGTYSGESIVLVSARQTLRIQNTPASIADYIVTLPANVHDVSVRLADGRAVPVTVGAGANERVIELSR